MPKRTTTKSKGKIRPKSKRVRGQKSTDPNVIAFCTELKRRRTEDYGLTLEQLSERADLTPNYIGTIENCYRDPSLSTLDALAQGLGMPLGELFGPPRKLSDAALAMAKLFSDMPEDIQTATLMVLRAATAKARAAQVGPR